MYHGPVNKTAGYSGPRPVMMTVPVKNSVQHIQLLFSAAENFRHFPLQFLFVNGFDTVFPGTELYGFLSRFDGWVASEHDHFEIGLEFFHFCQDLNTAEFFQFYIEYGKVYGILVDEIDGFFFLGERMYAMTLFC